jgi:sRNA-binding carbon storage regulator CsrA
MPRLVLGRRIGERIFITLPDGQKIIIELADIVNPNLTRIAITADESIIIEREEIAE